MNLFKKKGLPWNVHFGICCYGSEKENTVIKMTYNWDKKSGDYDLGDKYGHKSLLE